MVQRLAGPDTSAQILSTSGQIIASAVGQQSEAATAVVPNAAAIQAALSQPVDPAGYTLANDASGQRQIVVLIPLVENGGTVGFLELSAATTQVDRSVAAIRSILVAGVGVGLLLAALLAGPLISAALRPLNEMERTSQRIAAGALELRLAEPNAHDEIGRLARSFNLMVSRLGETLIRQRRFVADVSHELRTPLTALGGSVEMLLMGADHGDPTAARKLLRGMYAETGRMNRLVEDLLTLARLDDGRVRVRLEPLPVEPLLRDLMDETAALGADHVFSPRDCAGCPCRAR